MFQFARWVSLSVDIGDFLKLQRAFHSDRVVNPAAKKQRMIALNEVTGQRFNLGVLSDRRFHGSRNFCDGLLNQGLVQRVLCLASGYAGHEHHQCCKLGGKCFGRSHTNFRTGFGEEDKIAGTHNGAVINIADRQLRECVIIRQVFNGRERVGGFSRL